MVGCTPRRALSRFPVPNVLAWRAVWVPALLSILAGCDLYASKQTARTTPRPAASTNAPQAGTTTGRVSANRRSKHEPSKDGRSASKSSLIKNETSHTDAGASSSQGNSENPRSSDAQEDASIEATAREDASSPAPTSESASTQATTSRADDPPAETEEEANRNADDGAAATAASDPDEPAAADDEPTAADDEPAAADDEPAADATQKPKTELPFPRRRKAPELVGGVGWINTAGPLELKSLRGKWIVIDFWTYCCINCMHVLPELKKLEAAYPNEVVVIGVHSAKFDNEQDSKNITEAVMRYEIQHPVVNDAQHAIWDRYAVESWPSLRIIDPEGYLVAGDNGEIPFEVLDRFLKEYTPYYRERGLMDETPLRFDLAAYQATPTPLRFPGKILADEVSDRLFIADSNHNRLVISTLAGKLLATIGSGKQGAEDGDFATSSFNHPQGMALLQNKLYVADTENHLLRLVDLEQKQVKTIAGTGVQAKLGWPGMQIGQNGPRFEFPKRFVGPPLETGLNSPWDLWIHEADLYIAMAGPHQIWKMPLDESEIGPYAGNGREDIVDGQRLPPEPYGEGFASFAQPSGLASDGTLLFVADSEGSSIRAIPFEAAGEVSTVVGTANLPGGRLFAWGDEDGVGEEVRLQHALGVTYHEGRLYVADTYNNKIKVIDPAKRSALTIAGTGKPGNADNPAEFDEPAGVAVASTRLFVADTNNHLIRVIDLKNNYQVSTLAIEGLSAPELPEEVHVARQGKQIEVANTSVKPDAGAIKLAVSLQLPDDYKLNPLAPMRYQVEPSTAEGPVDRTGLGKSIKLPQPSEKFEIPLAVSQEEGQDELRVTLYYYYCREGAEGVCKMGQVTWLIPVTLSATAEASSIALDLNVE